jgi:hypothetical protein
MNSKKMESPEQLASAYQGALEIIAHRVTALGGNMTEALVRIGASKNKYSTGIDQVARALASISNLQK